jgi:hypothetical protein
MAINDSKPDAPVVGFFSFTPYTVPDEVYAERERMARVAANMGVSLDRMAVRLREFRDPSPLRRRQRQP